MLRHRRPESGFVSKAGSQCRETLPFEFWESARIPKIQFHAFRIIVAGGHDICFTTLSAEAINHSIRIESLRQISRIGHVRSEFELHPRKVPPPTSTMPRLSQLTSDRNPSRQLQPRQRSGRVRVPVRSDRAAQFRFRNDVEVLFAHMGFRVAKKGHQALPLAAGPPEQADLPVPPVSSQCRRFRPTGA